jgi:hypothetical protein
LPCVCVQIRLLESLNSELKTKVAEAQDMVVINSVPPSKGSLADELSASTRKTKPLSLEKSLSGHGSDDDSGDESPRKKVCAVSSFLNGSCNNDDDDLSLA